MCGKGEIEMRESLHQIVLLQIELEDSILDRGKDKPDILRVGRAREMRVDDLVAVRIQLDERLQNELPRRLAVLLRSCKCGKGNGEMEGKRERERGWKRK